MKVIQLQPASVEERGVVFQCAGERLVGIIHKSPVSHNTGLVVVVGGPQTRVGSHRQFVCLARMLAENGVPVLRFDYRGMGDSSGDVNRFDRIGPDIEAAVDVLEREAGVEKVVLWGLCDAVPAILDYSGEDDRICGVVLLNPWVRTEAGISRAYVHSHYSRRLLSTDFWRRFSSGDLDFRESTKAFIKHVSGSVPLTFSRKKGFFRKEGTAGLSLPEKIINDADNFNRPILLVLSGRDITAKEFSVTVETSSAWKRLISRGRIIKKELTEADHTFSQPPWSRQVEEWTLEWVRML